MPKIFISYRREDSEHITGRLYDRLEPYFHRDNLFMDINTIPYGVDFRAHLDQAVGQCDILLAVIGEHWLEIRFKDEAKQGQRRLEDSTDFVRIEISSALDRGIPVIPVLVGKASMPAETDLPDCLKRLAFRNAAEVRSGRDFHDHADRLIRGIDQLLATEQVRAKSKQKPAILLYPGQIGADARRVQSAQKEWADWLGVPVVETLELGGGVELEMVLVPPGKFMMGSPDSETNRRSAETLHEVEITRPYFLAKFPLTQEQYAQVMEVNPSWFSSLGGGKDAVKGLDTKRFPVEQVSWDEAVEFCTRLAKHGRGKFTTARLPTEAEWEYACRAGTRTPFHFGAMLNGTEANCDGNYPYGTSTKGKYLQRTSEVGEYAANALGIYDMHGNVWEWCMDWCGEYDSTKQDPLGTQSGSNRVIRGGGWNDDAWYCRAADRLGFVPVFRDNSLGVRPALVLSEDE